MIGAESGLAVPGSNRHRLRQFHLRCRIRHVTNPIPRLENLLDDGTNLVSISGDAMTGHDFFAALSGVVLCAIAAQHQKARRCRADRPTSQSSSHTGRRQKRLRDGGGGRRRQHDQLGALKQGLPVGEQQQPGRLAAAPGLRRLLLRTARRAGCHRLGHRTPALTARLCNRGPVGSNRRGSHMSPSPRQRRRSALRWMPLPTCGPCRVKGPHSTIWRSPEPHLPY